MHLEGVQFKLFSIIGCPPWNKEATNEFAWHWGQHGVHSCRDLSWLPSGSWDAPTAMWNLSRAFEPSVGSPILFFHRTVNKNSPSAQHSGVHHTHPGWWASPCSQKHSLSLGLMVWPPWSTECAPGFIVAVLSALSCLTLCNPVDYSPHAPLSMEFSMQEYWREQPLLSPGDLPNPGIEPRSPALQTVSIPSEPFGAT